MVCDIVIRSYRKDFAWLELCLAAVARHCEGFRDVIVAVPRSSAAWLRAVRVPDGTRLEICPDSADDYLGQQVTKLHADLLSDADLFCHVDSDCIFTRRTPLADLLDGGGRPVVAMRPYASLPRHWPWQRPTEAFLGWSVTHDFMQRPPFVFPRWLYAAVRAHAEAAHGRSLEEYVLAQPPRGFSEFNVLGAYAHRHHRDAFTWIEDGDAGPCRWYWSWGDSVEQARAETGRLLP